MSKRVLIVDDSLVSRMIIKEIVMSRYPDWECVQAASAEKAVDACNQSQFDYVTLDLNMPGKSG
ncbi:MAG: response regulator, partial [Kangiellaceae bacterium]|nr:response regulator [Kangiellaceae bacterium]